MFMWRSAPGFSSFTRLVSQPVRGIASASAHHATFAGWERALWVGSVAPVGSLWLEAHKILAGELNHY